jgi:hypothetical protein
LPDTACSCGALDCTVRGEDRREKGEEVGSKIRQKRREVTDKRKER